jgi:hypothetical protein
MFRSRKNQRSRGGKMKMNKTKGKGKGKKPLSNWIQYVKKVHAELKSKNEGQMFKDSIIEASNRKKENKM